MAAISTEVRLEGETVWLTQAQWLSCFNESVSDHQAFAQCFAEGELEQEAICAKICTYCS
jgi:hypothetical protein